MSLSNLEKAESVFYMEQVLQESIWMEVSTNKEPTEYLHEGREDVVAYETKNSCLYAFQSLTLNIV